MANGNGEMVRERDSMLVISIKALCELDCTFFRGLPN